MPARKQIEWKREGDCIVVVSHSPDVNGYPRAMFGGKQRAIHRVVCERRNGASSLNSIHSCDNRRCINPDHVSFGTDKQNMEGAVARKRNAFGERNGQSKLSASQASEIFSAAGTHREIAEQFKLSSHRTVGRIKKAERWKSIH